MIITAKMEISPVLTTAYVQMMFAVIRRFLSFG